MMILLGPGLPLIPEGSEFARPESSESAGGQGLLYRIMPAWESILTNQDYME